MKTSWAVLRVTLRSTFGISAMRWKYFKRREHLWEPILTVLGIGVGVGFFGWSIYRFALAACASGLVLGQPELGLGLAVVAAQVLVLFMGFFMIVSAFYFSTDITTLVPLPVRPGMIVTAKFATVLVGEYLTIAVFYWPSVAAYAQYVPFGVGKALLSVLVFLMLPVVPLAIGGAASLVMMRGINRRQRDLLFYAGSILFLVLVMAWQMAIARVPESGDIQKYLEELIRTRLGLVQALTNRFPPALWATGAIHEFPSIAGLRYLALTLGSGIAAIFALGALGNVLFMRGLLGSGEESRGRRAAQRGRLAGLRRQRAGGLATAADTGGGLLKPASTPLRALVIREWQMLSRTPIWMLNNVLPGLIMPVAMVMPLLAQAELRRLVDQVAGNPDGMLIAGAVLAAFLTFVGATAGVAPTSISREGGRLWISRMLPQSAETQVKAKIVLATIVLAASAVPTIVAFWIVFRPPVLYVVLPSLVGLVASFAVTCLGLRADTSRPMLKWTHPQEPVKRNLNAMVPMLVSLVLIAAGAGVTAAARSIGASGPVLYLLLLVVAGVAAVLMYRAAVGGVESRLRRLEL